jgi:hypothetical protein
MNPSFPPSLAGFHLQQHTQDHTQQPPISEADFLARVSAFERNEEAEARRARETMRRMISDQTKPSRHDRGCGSPKRRRDRSPPAGAAVGIFREFPYHFQGNAHSLSINTNNIHATYYYSQVQFRRRRANLHPNLQWQGLTFTDAI